LNEFIPTPPVKSSKSASAKISAKSLPPERILPKEFIATLDPSYVVPLSAMKSSKYIIQVEDKTTSDIFYTELNIVSNNSFAITSEYGTNYTTDTPFIEFGANIINQQVSLSATGINSFDMSNFIIKGNRTNLF